MRRRLLVLLPTLLAGVAAVAAAALLWASASDDGGEPVFTGVPVTDPGPVHVHALGLDPDDRSLYIATHTGLWRLAPARRARTA